jgi:hypothetical protein
MSADTEFVNPAGCENPDLRSDQGFGTFTLHHLRFPRPRLAQRSNRRPLAKRDVRAVTCPCTPGAPIRCANPASTLPAPRRVRGVAVTWTRLAALEGVTGYRADSTVKYCPRRLTRNVTFIDVNWRIPRAEIAPPTRAGREGQYCRCKYLAVGDRTENACAKWNGICRHGYSQGAPGYSHRKQYRQPNSHLALSYSINGVGEHLQTLRRESNLLTTVPTKDIGVPGTIHTHFALKPLDCAA